MANKLYLIIAALSLFFVNLWANNGQMEEANKLYSQGSYDEAITVYETIVSDGFVSGALFYNLGNAYYKTGQLAPAILNYERAKLYMPKDPDLDYNLQMSQRLVVDKIDVVDMFFMKRWIRSFRHSFSSDQWAVFGVAGIIALVLFISLYTFGKRLVFRQLGFYFSIIALLFTALSFTFSSRLKSEITESPVAIVFSPSVTVKSSPDDSGTELFILHEGTRVVVRDSIGDWSEIALSDGNVGWLKKDVIRKLWE
jgi:tetratricopeptide (TPR) repeat protein